MNFWLRSLCVRVTLRIICTWAPPHTSMWKQSKPIKSEWKLMRKCVCDDVRAQHLNEWTYAMLFPGSKFAHDHTSNHRKLLNMRVENNKKKEKNRQKMWIRSEAIRNHSMYWIYLCCYWCWTRKHNDRRFQMSNKFKFWEH